MKVYYICSVLEKFFLYILETITGLYGLGSLSGQFIGRKDMGVRVVMLVRMVRNVVRVRMVTITQGRLIVP